MKCSTRGIDTKGTYHYEWYVELKESSETATEAEQEEQSSNDAEQDGRSRQEVVYIKVVEVGLWGREGIDPSPE